MKIKQKKGHVVYSPLSIIFQMQELGGSYIQKYDIGMMAYEPNRELTPYALVPQLIVSDPDGVMATGNYASMLVNKVWDVYVVGREGFKEMLLASAYSINKDTGMLTLKYNVPVGRVLKATFTADFVDTRRNEVIPVSWTRDLTTEPQTSHNVTLDTGRWRSKVRLSPFKKWGKFGIPVQLKYGDNVVPDNKARYTWQWWDKTARAWKEGFDSCPWYVSGSDSKEITVDQDYIQNVLLRVKAVAFGESATTQYFTTRLRRWYGQYEEDVDFVTGKYIFADSDMVVLEAKVTNRQGNISDISKYFDCELFFAVGNNEFESVGHSQEVIVKRPDLHDGDPRAGILCRELSAYLPICDADGKAIADSEGCVIFAQFPTTEREV